MEKVVTLFAPSRIIQKNRVEHKKDEGYRPDECP
jgi:hypothetical protein